MYFYVYLAKTYEIMMLCTILTFWNIFADKSPQMNEFLGHIKATPELAAMYDAIQKDAVSTGQEIIAMDTS